jgi:hypothetical protein
MFFSPGFIRRLTERCILIPIEEQSKDILGDLPLRQQTQSGKNIKDV